MTRRGPGLLTIEEAAARISDAGIDYSVATLRRWRMTWPSGERLGPMPLLISRRRLRYSPADVDGFVEETLAQARRDAIGGGAAATG